MATLLIVRRKRFGRNSAQKISANLLFQRFFLNSMWTNYTYLE